MDLDAVYVNPSAPGCFSGVHILKRYDKRSERETKKFLAGRDAYTLHKPTRIRFLRRKTYSKGISDLYQIDLADMSSLSTFNDGMRYLLTCIDVFSKRAWTVPVRTKSGRDVTEAFEKILDDGQCNTVQSDKGTEFLNSTFQSMLRRRGIHFYTSENEDLKAIGVERFNRTLKTKMYRYFTHANTRRYVDVLDDLLYSYNNLSSLDRNGSGRSQRRQRTTSKRTSLSAETKIVQVEVQSRRQSAHRHATTTVSQRIPRRLVGRNIRDCLASADDAGNVRIERLGW